jgi:hypothetical protein
VAIIIVRLLQPASAVRLAAVDHQDLELFPGGCRRDQLPTAAVCVRAHPHHIEGVIPCRWRPLMAIEPKLRQIFEGLR